MLLPVLGFFLALLVFGGLGTLVTLADPYAARRIAPFAYAALFSGLGAFGSLFLLYLLADSACGLVLGAFTMLLLPAGCIAGAVVGCYLGIKRRRAATAELGLR